MIAQVFYNGYEHLFNPEQFLKSQFGTSKMPIPVFTKDQYRLLFIDAAESLKKQPTMMTLQSPIVVVGDIHGNLQDLFRLFWQSGHPYSTKYLFLGDYVDRGDFSIEVLSILLALHILIPENIFLIRGNHEMISQNLLYGFQKQLNTMFNTDDLFKEIEVVYSYLPLAAIIDEKYFCVHGGLTPKLSVDLVAKLERPISEFSQDKMTDSIIDLLWSDPDPEISCFMDGFRGIGRRYGEVAVAKFLYNNNLKCIIRGHECVSTGFRKRKNLVTLFSSSNYCKSGNDCGFARIKPEKEMTFHKIPIAYQLKRVDACFIKTCDSRSLSSLKSGALKRIIPITGRSRKIKRLSSEGVTQPILPLLSSSNSTSAMLLSQMHCGSDDGISSRSILLC